MRDVFSKEEELIEVLKLIAPGTPLREGLDNILRSRTGGLIVVGDSPEVLNLVDGGFNVNEEYTPAKLYELAKMDNAIVLSKDMKKILYANAQLLPSHTIATSETGTRHRTSERVAKQTGELVISISQRRSIITIFKGNIRYILEDTSKVLSTANQAMQTLEKYKMVFDSKLSKLNEYEFDDIVTLQNVITAIQRAEMVLRIVLEIQKNIFELGSEGRLIELQLNELIGDTEVEEELIIKDYIAPGKKRQASKIISELSNLSYEDLMKPDTIAQMLGYKIADDYEDINVYPKGYRILSKIPRMPVNIVENLVKSFKSFQHIIAASIEQLDEVEGIGEIRAKNIKQALKRIQEQYLIDSRLS